MEIKKKFTPDSRLKIMDQVRQVLQYHHYAYHTEQTYCEWIESYILKPIWFSVLPETKSW
ncbi:MAG: hypothetical protein SCALA701_21160 [Candidatus Scalindua sp.]|nr:MAG: hypothetical protein SCALA701_21160 [Candidatus Scalindua sp.]